VSGLALTGWWFWFSEDWWKWGDRYCTYLGFPLQILFQISQNVDTEAAQRKADELIRALPQADNRYIHLEDKKPQQ
jgi:low affinity Fe/Cu permease